MKNPEIFMLMNQEMQDGEVIALEYDFMLEIKANKVLNKSSITDNNEKVSGKILDYISSNPEITIPELAKNIGVTER